MHAAHAQGAPAGAVGHGADVDAGLRETLRQVWGFEDFRGDLRRIERRPILVG